MREEALTLLSWCFAPVGREMWEEATQPATWSDLLTFLSDEISSDAHKDALARLAIPPTYEEKARFAARHFTGGLPESALPIESLYVPASVCGAADQEYLREPALYLRDLMASLGLEVPSDFASCPDHLSIELEMAAFLYAENPAGARDFLAHRFAWLPAYAARLKSINADASFYVAAIEVLISVIDAWREER